MASAEVEPGQASRTTLSGESAILSSVGRSVMESRKRRFGLYPEGKGTNRTRRGAEGLLLLEALLEVGVGEQRGDQFVTLELFHLALAHAAAERDLHAFHGDGLV